MTRNILIVLAALAALAAFAQPAAAARPATPQEADAISAARGVTAACSTVIVSDRDDRYALWNFTPSDECVPTGNGFAVTERQDDGTWTTIYEASDPSEPCPLTDVPTEPGVDLGACARPSKHVYFPRYTTESFVIRPRKLPHGAHAALEGLRWRSWGRSTTAATGTMRYSDAYDRFSAPIRVRLSRVRFCGAKRTYTRQTITFTRAADRKRYSALDGTTAAGCPDGNDPR